VLQVLFEYELRTMETTDSKLEVRNPRQKVGILGFFPEMLLGRRLKLQCFDAPDQR
jgi:hypothetical protein